MCRFFEVFGTRRALLPVVHVQDEAQALRNTTLAREAGADGVFLINHGPSHETLIQIHERVHAEHSDWWVGVNCLDLPPEAVFEQIAASVAGVWVDNAGIAEARAEQDYAHRVDKARCHRSLENRPVIIGSKPAMFI